MNYTLIINVENKKDSYVRCVNLIDSILNNKFNISNYELLSLKLVETKHKNMPPNKLEEPLLDNNLSSSFSMVEKSKYESIIHNNFKSLKFHLRVNFTQTVDIQNLHYLAVLLNNFENLLISRRISVFLVPRTSNVFPYKDKNGYVDTELFKIASVHLRALIGDDIQGIIYGVVPQKNNKINTVKALDFKTTTKSPSSFPIIVLDGNQEYDIKIEQEYLNSDKLKNYSQHQKTFEYDNINSYSILFKDNIAYKYFDLASKLNRNRRFGFASHHKPKIALCDYLFECAYNMFIEKLKKSGLSLEYFKDNIPEQFFSCNIFTFCIFSFIVNFSEEFNSDTFRFNNMLKSCFELSYRISSGVEQIIQNSLQHTTCKKSIISFFKNNETNELRMILSDLSQETILDTFSTNLENEKKCIKNITSMHVFETLSQNLDYYKTQSYKNRKIELNLKCLFNDFEKLDNQDKLLNSWYNFRQLDSSAHIGMVLFSNAIKRCNGKFSVVSSTNIHPTGSDVEIYCSDYHDKKELGLHIPGTEYIVVIPIEHQKQSLPSSFAKINNTNYLENYDSFAEFIDYDVKYLSYNTNKDFINYSYQKVKNIRTSNALDKFYLQIMWTNYWLDVFEHIKLLPKQIHCIDYSSVKIKEVFLENNFAKETIIKGLIDALGVFSTKNADKSIYLALVNVDPIFLKLFKEISITLSIKKFPDNVQFFISDNTEKNQIHLVGFNYGFAIQNSYLLSVENYFYGYNGNDYYDSINILKPFYNIINSNMRETVVKIVPFLGLVKSSLTEHNLFFSKIKEIADKDIISENGFKFKQNHTRLGNKVHINSFYEMSHLFHRTILANHVAFYILKDIFVNDKTVLLNNNILFYGYASYSQAILMSLTKILESYRTIHNENSKSSITYGIYQYNLQYETDFTGVNLYLSNSNLLNSDEKIKVIQIVPISSTLTTFSKMWNRFSKDCNQKETFVLYDNYTVFWVKDMDSSPRAIYDDGKESLVSVLEYKYFDIVENKVKSKFSVLGDNNLIKYIIDGSVKWEQPELCTQCFPETNMLEEVPLIETDPTSTVPSQQIHPYYCEGNIKTQKLPCLDKRDVEKYQKLYGNVYYGHIRRGKNHYQYFIDTQSYFADASHMIKNWLESLRNSLEVDQSNYPTIDIIFSPSHNTNVGFSQYVNAYYFNGSAEIISINEDKIFTSNFCCEYAMLKNTIKRFVDDFIKFSSTKDGSNSELHQYKPVRFIFVDDNIITGDSFRKANKLLQSLLPDEIKDNYGTNVFDKCFVLIDRMSNNSKKAYIFPSENFHAFCKIDISSMRKQGDSCVCCKLKNQVQRLYNRSATQYASNYWRLKWLSLEEKSFDLIVKEVQNPEYLRKSFSRMMLSHMLKEFFKNDVNNCHEIYNKILQFLGYYSSTSITDLYESEAFEFLSSYDLVFSTSEYSCIDKKEFIINIIKIMSRPFFTYNQTIKQAVLRFIIVLTETIIDAKASENEFFSEHERTVAETIKSMFGSEYELIGFLQDVLFDALTDMQSTYLLRYQTIKKVLLFANEIYMNSSQKGNIQIEELIKNFLAHYSIYFQRLVDGRQDETRSLRLEYFLISCCDTFSETYDCTYNKSNGATFYEKFLKSIEGIELHDTVKKSFKIFCEEIFFSNGRILYDGIEKIYLEKDQFINELSDLNLFENKDLFTDNYFMERWEKFRRLDYNWINLSATNNRITKEIDLFKLFCSKPQQDIESENKTIEIRYQNFLHAIRDMISEKYSIDTQNIRLALLTCSKAVNINDVDNAKNITLRDLEVIKSYIESTDDVDSLTKQQIDSDAKYTIKKRILDIFTDKEFNIYGYKIGQIEDVSNSSREFNSASISYIILKFCNKSNTEKLVIADKAKTIVPVYLYVSVDISDNTCLQRSVLPRLIIRDILIYRKEIISYLEEDFTNDVMEKYARSIDTEAILKNEKVMSHTPMDQDKYELRLLLDQNSKETLSNIDKIKSWSIARNYCNTMIARLYNRVFRNINRSFDKIIDEYKNINRETYKLYISSSSDEFNDGKNFPLLKVGQVIPTESNETDVVYSLFREIISFNTTNLPQNISAYKYSYNGKDYAYNLDYVKSIIYRICFDAMRFSYGSGAEKDDFVARVEHHYQNKLRECLREEKNNNKWLKSIPHNICFVSFSVEKEHNSKNFDWLVIKNELYKPNINNTEFIHRKLEDPLDFTDGHMSLITAKEYFSKMLCKEDVALLENMYSYQDIDNKRFFVTKLPLIKKGEFFDE